MHIVECRHQLIEILESFGFRHWPLDLSQSTPRYILHYDVDMFQIVKRLYEFHYVGVVQTAMNDYFLFDVLLSPCPFYLSDGHLL